MAVSQSVSHWDALWDAPCLPMMATTSWEPETAGTQADNRVGTTPLSSRDFSAFSRGRTTVRWTLRALCKRFTGVLAGSPMILTQQCADRHTAGLQRLSTL